MSVIILSDKRDAHIPYVAKHLSAKPVIIDFQDIVDKGELAIVVDKNRTTALLHAQRISNVSGVWLRRPQTASQLDIPTSPSYLAYCQSALRNFTDILFSLFGQSVWVSNYYAILQAENKPLQQQIAVKAGFVIPATIYTADVKQARTFIKTHGTCVVKTLSSHIPASREGKPQGFYTRRIASPDDLQLDGLRLAPAIFQRFILPRHEFRVTVVGDQVFATRIDSPNHDIIRDWRMHQRSRAIKLHTHRLPLSVQEKCVAVVRELGLNFGAIDLIQDAEGVFWFLEINPNGQWAFVEQASGQPIGKAIADMLQ